MARYIDRELALSMPFANRHYDHENANEHYIFGCETYKEWLETLPTADVRENVHGKWIEKDGTDWEYSKEYNCSVCGKYRLVTNPAGWEWNYCPNCGARMDK